MDKQRDKYTVAGINLFDIRNRNEIRVAEALRAALAEYEGPALDAKTVRDAYAYALNQLPSRYAQGGTIVLRDPVRAQTIRAAVDEALNRALDNPKK